MPPLSGSLNIAQELKKDLLDDQAIGRSAGGLSTKIHAVCDARDNPVTFHLTAGQDLDLQESDALMDEITKAEAVLADKAYDADEHVNTTSR